MTSYRELLKKELARRTAKNAGYSMRSFARDLGVSASTLSEVMKHKYGFSVRAAEKIASRLKLSDSERVQFCASVTDEAIATDQTRKKTNQRLNHIVRKKHLPEDVVQVTSDWYHDAILEMLALKEVEHRPEWFAKRLGISVATAKSALERLIRAGLLQFENKRYQDCEPFTSTSDNIPSRAIRSRHRQLLEKAIASIETQSIEERNLSSVTIAIDTDDLPEIAERIKKFRRKLIADFGKADGAKSVYAFNAQLFSLLEKKS